jgi:murein DD-endopeptidase MepM/ murein hydrolase activator NlpD
MKYWPVPNSYSKHIPKKDTQGSFWEERDDRYHCGIDIYAPAGSKVISVSDGSVIETGIFTDKKIIPYWNKTKYIIIKNQDGFYCKYAELNDLVLKEKDIVQAGQLIGHLGFVLNIKKITEKSPLYIQKIKNSNNPSMLHFEVYNSIPLKNKKYLGGNCFGNNKPENLINPECYLKKLI